MRATAGYHKRMVVCAVAGAAEKESATTTHQWLSLEKQIRSHSATGILLLNSFSKTDRENKPSMGNIKRQIDPYNESIYWEKKVEYVANLFTRIRSRFEQGRFSAIAISKKYIHKQPKTYYYKVFRNVVETLEELRGDNSNSYETLAEDYLNCIHSFYYERYKRLPYLQQVVPTELTLSVFGGWVSKWEESHGQPYWITSNLSEAEASSKATESILAAQRAHISLLDSARAFAEGKETADPDLLSTEPVDMKAIRK